MVAAKARTMLFEQWWRECVVRDDRAETPHRELYQHYRRWGHSTGMGEQAFTARLNEMSIGQRKERGVRYRLGVRLRPPPAEAEPRPVAPIAAPPSRAPLFRLAPIAQGEGEPSLGLMLEIAAPEDEASARVAEELFAERLRQVAEEGRSRAGDDDGRLAEGDLANAASAYAYAAAQPDDCARYLELSAKLERPPIRRGWVVIDFLRLVWPWDTSWWKPQTDAPGWRRRCLVKAGALIIAAIEKLDRANARAALSADEHRQATGL